MGLSVWVSKPSLLQGQSRTAFSERLSCPGCGSEIASPLLAPFLLLLFLFGWFGFFFPSPFCFFFFFSSPFIFIINYLI